MHEALEQFDPAVAAWFAQTFGTPTEAQWRAWPSIRRGQATLVAAPTGSGKTLAAFLATIDDLVRQAATAELEDETTTVYVSPLKALSRDIETNLQVPLAGIALAQREAEFRPTKIRVMVRTGDTPASERALMVRKPPHIVVTTPESLYLLLTSEKGRAMLRTTRTVIVDEIHALAGNKRGAHLALSLARLDALTERPAVRIGLSATQKPVEEIARFLVGAGPATSPAPCTIIDIGHRRDLDMAIEVPRSPLGTVMSTDVWLEVYDRIAELIREHRTTLVFVGTRRTAERATRHLAERIGAGSVAAHHGSLAREQRHRAEQRLKAGELRALVATASLELGIDIGAVDLVCQIGSPRAISTWLQRVGRSGHTTGGRSKGRLFPSSRDDLVECAALIDAVGRGELDRIEVPNAPIDILAQQIVAECACREWEDDELFALVRAAHPYRNLERERFEETLEMLADGYATRRGRRGALIHRDRVASKLRGRRGARLIALTSGGAIPDNADYAVIQEPVGTVIGTVHEDFAVESAVGDIFQLGNASWRIAKVEPGKVRVEDARGAPPTIPFWLGEGLGRTAELSGAVSRLRGEVDAMLAEGERPEIEATIRRLADRPGLGQEASRQIVEYLAATRAALGAMPTQETLVMERFFDESGGMQLVVHAPFGSRVNRAWGLALRKRFCKTFDFELQAAATDDAIVISLGPMHSFPLEDVFDFVRSSTVEELLVPALLDAPMFPIRWRWNIARSLAAPRFRGGRRVPPPLQRMEAEDLLAAIFPDQLACLQDKGGSREIPDHPLVDQTIQDCLHEAMDIDRLREILVQLERGELRRLARDLPEPSPLAQEILNARPYAYLDDAPLEERRTQAVLSRRWIDPMKTEDLGALDEAAILRVRDEAWPRARDADELLDALDVSGFLSEAEALAPRPPDEEAEDATKIAGASRRVDRRAPGRIAPQQPSWPDLFDQLRRASRAVLVEAGHAALVEAGHAALVETGPAALVEAGHAALVETGPAALIEAGGAGSERSRSRAAVRLWVARERLDQVRSALGECVWDPPVAPLNPGRKPAIRQASAHQAAEDSIARSDDALVELVRARLEILGPVTAQELASPLGLPPGRLEAALARLEAEGFVLRGRFRAQASEREYCSRRLLARIHRLTLDRLRREIEPVPAAVFLRFLLGWHGVTSDARGEGPAALERALGRLSGFDAPASAWEGEILPARMTTYDPAALDGLCVSGKVAWLRKPGSMAEGAAPHKTARDPSPRAKRRAGPIRTTPITLLPRSDLAAWVWTDGARVEAAQAADTPDHAERRATAPESGLAAAVRERLASSGALFFDDIVRGVGALAPQIEMALAELVAAGRVTSDSFAGLRALLTPAALRSGRSTAGRRRGALRHGMEHAGRWSLVGNGPADGTEVDDPRSHRAEVVAKALLVRYGVVFRRVADRERSDGAPWRDLLRALRRMEARGEIRGGRFVEGFSGEQYALPEAVAALRASRRAPLTGELVALSAADPLNLIGIITPGERLASVAGNRLVLKDGVPVAVKEGAEVRMLGPLADTPAPADEGEEWEIRTILLRRRPTRDLQPWLGRTRKSTRG